MHTLLSIAFIVLSCTLLAQGSIEYKSHFFTKPFLPADTVSKLVTRLFCLQEQFGPHAEWLKGCFEKRKEIKVNGEAEGLLKAFGYNVQPTGSISAGQYFDFIIKLEESLKSISSLDLARKIVTAVFNIPQERGMHHLKADYRDWMKTHVDWLKTNFKWQEWIPKQADPLNMAEGLSFDGSDWSALLRFKNLTPNQLYSFQQECLTEDGNSVLTEKLQKLKSEALWKF